MHAMTMLVMLWGLSQAIGRQRETDTFPDRFLSLRCYSTVTEYGELKRALFSGMTVETHVRLTEAKWETAQGQGCYPLALMS